MRRSWFVLQMSILVVVGVVETRAQQAGEDSIQVGALRQDPPRQRLIRVPEPADPLEPWSLEAGVFQPVGGASGTETSIPEPLSPSDSLGAGASMPDGVVVDSLEAQEMVLVVRCRQILMARGAQVEDLEKLLKAGVAFEQAKNTLGLSEVAQWTREYAIDELAPDIAEEIVNLPDSSWSRARPWRGRSLLFQVLSRRQSPRAQLPALGDGLGEQEQRRIADLLRQRRPEAPVEQQQQPIESELQPAVVVEQMPAEYPSGATQDGEVNLIVEVGRLDQVVSVRVESSSDPIFEEAAIQAARASRYRAGRRGPTQMAEPGSVRLTYRFRVPQQGNP